VNSDRDERGREKVDRGDGHRWGETYRETFRERTVTKGAETERTKTDKKEKDGIEIKVQIHKDRHRGHPYQG
jgi:hypothetical protein